MYKYIIQNTNYLVVDHPAHPDHLGKRGLVKFFPEKSFDHLIKKFLPERSFDHLIEKFPPENHRTFELINPCLTQQFPTIQNSSIEKFPKN